MYLLQAESCQPPLGIEWDLFPLAEEAHLQHRNAFFPCGTSVVRALTSVMLPLLLLSNVAFQLIHCSLSRLSFNCFFAVSSLRMSSVPADRRSHRLSVPLSVSPLTDFWALLFVFVHQNVLFYTLKNMVDRGYIFV